MITEFDNGNVAYIEGILAENGLKEFSYDKDGQKVEAIGGEIKIRVDTQINKKDVTLDIPVRVFSKKLTKEGAVSKIYTSLKTVKETFVSIAASDIDKADRVRITSGKVAMNEFWNKNNEFISEHEITTNFINRISKENCNPDATFDLTFMIGKMSKELDDEGIETGRLKITAIVPKFGGRVDVIPLIAENKGVIEAITQYWEEGNTVTAQGKLNFSVATEKDSAKDKYLGFGEIVNRPQKTKQVSELIISGGNPEPYAEGLALNADEVKIALKERQVYIDSLKDKKTTKAAPKVVASSSSNAIDLGF